MNDRKILPLWLFRILGILILLLCTLATAYFWLTDSGPFNLIAELLGDLDGSEYTLALLLTFIICTLPGLVLMLILRPFSNVPKFTTQLTDMGPFTASFKTDIDTSQFGELPSVVSRILAFIIDRILVILIVALPAAVFIAVDEQVRQTGILYYISLLIFLIFLLIGVMYSYSRDMFGGKSIARRLLKQKVVDISTGIPIGGWRSLKREIIIHFAPLILIELILISSNKQRRRMGDNWAKTIVVKDKS